MSLLATKSDRWSTLAILKHAAARASSCDECVSVGKSDCCSVVVELVLSAAKCLELPFVLVNIVQHNFVLISEEGDLLILQLVP